MLIVVALGGNAVSLPGKEGNIAEQFAATRVAMHSLADLISAGHQLVITHGNGPQVGNVMRRVEIAAHQLPGERVYPLPLDIVVADTEAGMGYMISQCLMNELASRGIGQLVTTIITTIRVDESDPAMNHPDKPVGPFLSATIASAHAGEDGWVVKDFGKAGWRRVVPSPSPREIVELPLIRKLVNAGETIVAGGGGGIPVTRDGSGMYRGVEAVIDKDRTSSMLARELGADRLVILTNVDRVQLNYGKPDARELDLLAASEAQTHLKSGEFGAGSMGPKIEAAIDFVRAGGKPGADVLITSCERAADGFAGRTGTRIVAD
ncbi:MAG: carbamate kinase [Tepidisphaeraceae bacterium]